MDSCAVDAAQAIAVAPAGIAVLDEAIAVDASDLQLISRGIGALWTRIVSISPHAENSPLLLSYDVHPTEAGPVLIEVNTNAGGVISAFAAARRLNGRCADWEQLQLQQRLLALFRRDLLGGEVSSSGTVAIVDDDLLQQPLQDEMRAVASLLIASGADVRVVDASELDFSAGRLRHRGIAIDRVYWRSTDFRLAEVRHEVVRRAVDEGTTSIAPSPDAYGAIADKRRFVEWSRDPELARDGESGRTFRVAYTQPMTARASEEWYSDRRDWVFKPANGHASRGVYVGRSISRQKLAELPRQTYLAQRHAPHPVAPRGGAPWKYDLRFFADRGEIIGAVARVFQGQVVGMRQPGSGFAPISVRDSCCLVGALAVHA